MSTRSLKRARSRMRAALNQKRPLRHNCRWRRPLPEEWYSITSSQLLITEPCYLSTIVAWGCGKPTRSNQPPRRNRHNRNRWYSCEVCGRRLCEGDAMYAGSPDSDDVWLCKSPCAIEAFPELDPQIILGRKSHPLAHQA